MGSIPVPPPHNIKFRPPPSVGYTYVQKRVKLTWRGFMYMWLLTSGVLEILIILSKLTERR